MPTTSILAVITGSSSGIGLELEKLAAKDGYSLVLAADTPFDNAIQELSGATIETLNVDLSTAEGVIELDQLIGSRKVDVLCANAGYGLGKALDLLQRIGRRMKTQGSGRILLTGSMAGFMPGAY
jgi:short-subunit dehydrogenase